jgi:hypothetical protein
MLSGMAILADQEIARQRLLGALDDRIRANPLGRYSLHTNDDFTADLDGIQILWTGDDRQTYGTGLDGLVQSLDPGLALQMDRRLAAAKAALRLLDSPSTMSCRRRPTVRAGQRSLARPSPFTRWRTRSRTSASCSPSGCR